MSTGPPGGNKALKAPTVLLSAAISMAPLALATALDSNPSPMQASMALTSACSRACRFPWAAPPPDRPAIEASTNKAPQSPRQALLTLPRTTADLVSPVLPRLRLGNWAKRSLSRSVMAFQALAWPGPSPWALASAPALRMAPLSLATACMAPFGTTPAVGTQVAKES